MGFGFGKCCFWNGFCGSMMDYCSVGCQSGFGICFSGSGFILIDGICGFVNKRCVQVQDLVIVVCLVVIVVLLLCIVVLVGKVVMGYVIVVVVLFLLMVSVDLMGRFVQVQDLEIVVCCLVIVVE